jgi:hypothetical protein
MFLVAQVIEPPRETVLSIQCDGYDLGRLSLSASIEDKIVAGVMCRRILSITAVVHEALMRFGDLNREAGDEVEGVEVDGALTVGAMGIDANRGAVKTSISKSSRSTP